MENAVIAPRATLIFSGLPTIAVGTDAVDAQARGPQDGKSVVGAISTPPVHELQITIRESRRAGLEDLLKNNRYFENRAVLHRFGTRSKLRQLTRLQQLRHRASGLAVAAHHDAHFFLAHPLRVVALLRQRPRV